MTEEIENLDLLIEGLKTKISEKEEIKDKFTRAAGLDEMSERVKKEADGIEAEIDLVKEEITELKFNRATALKQTVLNLSKKLNETLPSGFAYIKIDEGSFEIGWNKDSIFRPYHALSGSEKIIFDGALANAFQANFLWYEGAEIDNKNMAVMLEKLLETENQVVIATWFKPSDIPEGWTVIEL